jgi:hypothetical protein
MRKFWLICALLFLIAFVVMASLAYLTDNNTISLTLFAVISLSGFSLSFSNFVLAKSSANNKLVLLTSLVIFVSTIFSFQNQNWFELSWNFNLAGHIFVCCFALFKSIRAFQNTLTKILKTLFILVSICLILVVLLKASNSFIFSIFNSAILILALGIILIHTLSRKKV